MEIDPRDYLSPADAAARLKISAETVRRWARLGTVRAVKIGGRIFVHRSVLLVHPVTGGSTPTSNDSQE